MIDLYLRRYAQLFSTFEREMWNYEDHCVLIGLEALYQATGDEYWKKPVSAFMDRYIQEDGSIRLYDPKEYNIDKIPGGRLLFTLYEDTGNEKYRLAIENLMNQLREHPRAACGSFWHKKIYPDQIWLDGLYMGLPFYVMYGKKFGEPELAEDAVRQFENARANIYDEKAKLYYHAWDQSRKAFWCDKQTGLSPNFWSRSLGWYVMAAADVYEYLETDDQRERLARIWREALEGIVEYQDESGMFYQLTALKGIEGNYLETSATLMFAYSILKGIRLSVLPEKLLENGLNALIGVVTHELTLKDGRLSLGGMCKGAGLGPEGNWKRDGSVSYYLAEEVIADEQKGTGICMAAYAEYLRAKLPDGYPIVKIYDKDYDPIIPGTKGFKETM